MALNTLIYNYIFVQISILLFVAPFLLLYFYFNPHLKLKHIIFNKFIEDFLSSKFANWLIFFWAMAETIFWYIIPEFLLLLIVFLKIEKKKKLLIYDFLGTFLGIILSVIIFSNFDIKLTQIPFVTQGMINQVDYWYKSLGIIALIHQPFSGIPFKVFISSAVKFSYSIPLFMVFSLIMRMARYYILYYVFDGLYPFFHKYISKHYIPIFVTACFVFSFMLLKIVLSYGILYRI